MPEISQDVAPAEAPSEEAAEPSGADGGAPPEEAGGDGSTTEEQRAEGKADKKPAPPEKQKQNLGRAWDRLHRDRREFAAKQAEWDRGVQQMQSMYAQFQQEREAFRKERENWSRKLKEAPLEALEEAGLPFEKLTDTAVRRNTPEYRLEQLEKERAEERAERQREKEAAASQEKQRTFEAAKAEFAKWTKLNDKDYPLLSEEDADYIGRKAAQVAPELKQMLGRIPLNEEIAKELESRLDGRYSRHHAKKQKLASPSGSQEPSERGNGAGSGPGKPSGQAPTGTLTNDDATERSGSRALRMTPEQKRIASVAEALPDFLQ